MLNSVPCFTVVTHTIARLTDKPEADSALILPASLHQCSVLGVS